MKRLGAVLLDDAVWVLPDQPRTAEQFQWLAAEIQELGGEVYSWRATRLFGQDEDALTQQFNEQVNKVYSGLLEQLEKKRPDLAEISRQYQQTVSQDFFKSILGLQVREKLMSKRGEKP